jgi:hypothetical protein
MGPELENKFACVDEKTPRKIAAKKEQACWVFLTFSTMANTYTSTHAVDFRFLSLKFAQVLIWPKCYI